MMDIIILRDGNARCLYDEKIELAVLGQTHIRRASYVEPDREGRWWTDLSPVHGPRLGPFSSRSAGLAAEVQWLNEHWLDGRSRR